MGRHRADAHRRHDARHPGAALRHRHRRAAAAEPQVGDDRDRRRQRPDLRAVAARVDALATQRRLRAGCPFDRGPAAAHRHEAHPAQLDVTGDRAGHIGAGYVDHRRGRARVPRAGLPGPRDHGVGPDARRLPEPSRHLAAARPHPRCCDRLRRPRFQPRRRRPPGSPRPEVPAVRMALLSVKDLSVRFSSRGRGTVQAVDGLNFEVPAGATVGLVGESGCGKSVTSLAIMGLLPKRGVRVSGSVTLDGTELLGLPETSMRRIRGREIAMVFQDPLSSLNPVVTIGKQVTEVLERHRGLHGEAARTEAAALLERVGIPDPRARLISYPHQLSGGMRQRALIAMALACKPRLLIADEPTTALDVTIQAQILELLRELVRETGAALVMITHDLGVVAGLCETVGGAGAPPRLITHDLGVVAGLFETVNVLYAGRIVERAQRHRLFSTPR